MNTRAKIVIADHQECSLLGMQSFLMSSITDMEVVGLVSSEMELLQIAESYEPDIIITEIKSPVLNGIEGAKQFTQKYPHISLIAFTGYEEIYIIHQLVNAGINGCVSKNGSMDELLLAIQSVREGENYYCPVTQEKLNEFSKSGFSLSSTDIDVLSYCCEGKTSGQIAKIMYKSRRTIEHNRDTIKQKFHVKTNGELMMAAIAKGYYCIRIFIGLVTHLPFFNEDLITLLA